MCPSYATPDAVQGRQFGYTLKQAFAARSFPVRIERMASNWWVVLLGIGLFCPAASRADLIVNGGFETPAVGATGISVISPGAEPGGFGWTVGAGTVEVFGELGALPGPAFDGIQLLDLNGISVGALSQTFATVAGHDYWIEFAYANNYVHTGPGNPALALVSLFDAASSADLISPMLISHGTSAVGNLDWTLATLRFTAIGSLTTLRFDSQSPTPFGGILLDGVRGSAAIPEPSSVVLLGIGAVVAGCWWRRNRAG